MRFSVRCYKNFLGLLSRDRALRPVITPLACHLEPGEKRITPRAALDKGMPHFERAFPADAHFRFQLFDEREIAYVDIRHGASDD